MKDVIVIGGPNGAGKSTAASQILADTRFRCSASSTRMKSPAACRRLILNVQQSRPAGS